MAKLYGSLNNRFDEGRNYNDDKLIHEGDDLTKYWWSDRTCYYVTKVIDQTHIFIHDYHVCADHSKAGGMGHQDWLYFKTIKEHNRYLNSLHLQIDGRECHYNEDIPEPKDTEIMLRRGKWKVVSHYNLARWEKALEIASERYGADVDDDKVRWIFDCYKLTPRQFEAVKAGKDVLKFSDFGNISFGVRDYHYDWEF